ncbi:MAG: sigma-70 family RNA polymerase sigma factor [Pirellulaceae bacterium]
MPDESGCFAQQVREARDGCRQSLNEVLTQCRDYLLLIANHETQAALRQKVGASDIVQQSLINAEGSISAFRGTTRPEFLAWIRGILKNEILNHRRRYLYTHKRCAVREILLNVDDSRLDAGLMDSMVTPGAGASLAEEAVMVRHAVASLSASDQQIIRLRVWDRLSFAEIGAEMDRSDDACQKLWTRAIMRLKGKLHYLSTNRGASCQFDEVGS